ncbi:TPA: hypothetical protein JLJ42_001145 [Escherichia coli]|uniref:hypothetical protein n=1 Tax=Escherichia coli TaxID=562 RepID=UPI00163ECAB4|nr:hypothetical protein [Escherichia coli]EJZ9501525.1 hypothetical protein [Escherichia coli]MCO4884220.1 hypothetical protein [Escherichia coli]HAW0524824.1 hypothetical protein [Escherichia coli]HCN8394611.1 hypothetical protein [Escherichia coli]HDW3617419.1 hypothetical protein [Escherichia coli]
MLDFIRDIFASFRQSSLERVRSPFLGAFVFSWLGFNWPILAILFFSNREIEKRLVYITDNFGIESYLIGPLCTSALIAYLLPKINKLVTKIQNAPNTETIEMSLQSKIKIAELQQSIAEIDARKKLSEKKEERYIEEGIYKIKKELEDSTSLLKGTTEAFNKKNSELNELKGQLSTAESKFVVESDAKKSAQNDLIKERENNRILGDKLVEMSTSVDNYKRILNSVSNDNETNVEIIKGLQAKLDRTEAYIDILVENYPQIFKVVKTENAIVISIKEGASINLSELNNSLKLRSISQSMNTPY